MGKVFRRLICFFLGVVIGAVATIGGVATSMYYMYGNVTVGSITDDTVPEFGDVNDYSVEDLVALVNRAMNSPDDYTFRDLEEKYGIDFTALLKRLVGEDVITDEKIEQGYIDDLKSVSLFSLFSGDGLNGFLSGLPMGAVLAFIPEDSISPQERAKLRRYSVGQLLETDEYTGQPGLFTAIRDIAVGGLLPNQFEYDLQTGKYRSASGKKSALDLLANVKLGAVVDSFVTGTSDIVTEIVEGGLSDLGGYTFGELVGYFIDDAEITSRVDALFSGMRVRDAFTKNAEGEYEFSVENLTDNVKIGGLLGYEYDEDEGVWKQDGEEVKGVMKVLAGLDVTTLYLAFTSDGDITDKISNALLAFGDLTIGDVFETLGFEKDEEGNFVDLNGKFLNSLTKLSLADVIGDGDLSPVSILRNILGAIKEYNTDVTFGEGLGELFGIVPDGNGGYKYTDPEKGEVNYALSRLLDVKISDFVGAIGDDEPDVMNIINVFNDALSGIKVGDLLGYKKDGGVWVDENGEQVNEMLGLLSEVSFSAVFDVINGESDPASIIDALLSEMTLGDVVAATIGNVTAEGEGKDRVYYIVTDGEKKPLSDGLNSLLNVKISQVADGFMEDGDFDLIEELKNLTFGDALNLSREEGTGLWYIEQPEGNYYFTGALTKLLSWNIGELTDPDYDAEHFTDKLLDLSVGDLISAALGYYTVDGNTVSKNGVEVNKILAALSGSGLTINEIIKVAQGEEEFDYKEKIHEILLGLRVGDVLELAYSIDTDENGDYTAGEKTGALLDPVYNLRLSVIFDDVMKIVEGEELGYDEIIIQVYGHSTVGELFVPLTEVLEKDVFAGICAEELVEFVKGLVGDERLDYVKGLFEAVKAGNLVQLFMDGLEEGEDGWYKDGEKLHDALGDLFFVTVGGVIEVIAAEGDFTDKVLASVELLSGKERKLGEYFTFDYLEDKVAFETLLNETVYGFAEGLAGRNADYKDDPLGYLLSLFETVKVGNVVQLFVDLSDNDDGWYDGEKLLADYVTDALNVTVGDVKELILSDADAKERVLLGVEDLCGRERTLGDYLEEIEELEDKKTLTKLLAETVYGFTEGVLGLNENYKDDSLGYILSLFDEYKLGELLADLPIGFENDGNVWAVSGTELPL
ncbi:MAG: hypothetical protein IJS67_03035, partial [Clostridia bacterium]|nr:hypothetical protein [Clostridia bacterium]